MAGPARVELRLLGLTLSIRTDASPEYVNSLAAYVEERVAAVQQAGVREPMTALALAALDIVDELFHAREDRTREAAEVRSRLGSLVTLLQGLAGGAEPAVVSPRTARGGPRAGESS
jgi:cell division protein ZapA (FtsZ GTPase activity inhibitor)